MSRSPELHSGQITSFWQIHKKACIGTIVAVLALTTIGLVIAQKTGAIDMVKFGQTKAGMITYSVMGGLIGMVGLGALGIYCKTKNTAPLPRKGDEYIGEQVGTSQNTCHYTWQEITYSINYYPDGATALQLKQAVAKRTGQPEINITVLCSGRQLIDQEVLSVTNPSILISGAHPPPRREKKEEPFETNESSLGTEENPLGTLGSRGKCDYHIKTLSGKMITICCYPDTTTVKEFKEALAKRTESPVDRIRLVFAGKQFENEMTIADYYCDYGDPINMSPVPSS